MAAIRHRTQLQVGLAGFRPQWDAWCEHRGVTPAEGVRQLIAAALARAPECASPQTGTQLPAPVVGERCKRIYIRLTAAELDAVVHMAAAAGFPTNRWIVALIRARLTGAPQFGEREMVLLAASNRELATIGRFLGAIARACDAMPAQIENSELHLLAGIKNRLDTHLRTVADLVRANLDRWSR
ncbi:plasmid stabilization protein [Paraburkholderia sp. BL10I2N1]|uniref:plasmid stabilization protein n=1 Tax=Paraburkholderia sp. BL10I2N1 TaxID=1938796 RepID=UPI0010617B9B|nr:plasmid stabilization protein [Paraburkholderia sp. BL10I2N1]TDN67162.1 hypothetical protein B0G77_0408 [Paraburkholderia sp. BL10I2N1]